MQLVHTFAEVEQVIRRFNEALARSHSDAPARALAERLAFNRAWYYSPTFDEVGPSKFIGYAKMTAKQYVTSEALDGRHTEPVLRQWFQPLAAGTPEEAFVRAKVEALLARHGTVPNRAVRFCAPFGWKAPGTAASSHAGSHEPVIGRHTIHATITRSDSYYVAECDRLAVVSQGTTLDEAVANLKEAVELHLEGEDLQALGLAPRPVVVVTLELLPWAA